MWLHGPKPLKRWRAAALHVKTAPVALPFVDARSVGCGRPRKAVATKARKGTFMSNKKAGSSLSRPPQNRRQTSELETNNLKSITNFPLLRGLRFDLVIRQRQARLVP